MLCGVLGWVFVPNVRILPHNSCLIAGTACLLAGREIWGDGKKEWAEDHLFRMELRDGHMGIYTVGSESDQLVDLSSR
jgi:hypothetical protein